MESNQNSLVDPDLEIGLQTRHPVDFAEISFTSLPRDALGNRFLDATPEDAEALYEYTETHGMAVRFDFAHNKILISELSVHRNHEQCVHPFAVLINLYNRAASGSMFRPICCAGRAPVTLKNTAAGGAQELTTQQTLPSPLGIASTRTWPLKLPIPKAWDHW